MYDAMTPSITVQIMSGPDDGRRITFESREPEAEYGASWAVTVGRRDDCDICLPFDTQVSRLHARLRYQPERGWLLEDSGSRNGTYVGGQRIGRAVPLAVHTLFRVGRTWLRLEHIG